MVPPTTKVTKDGPLLLPVVADKKSSDGSNSTSGKNTTISASDMTRRMVCGGLSGMIAKVIKTLSSSSHLFIKRRLALFTY